MDHACTHMKSNYMPYVKRAVAIQHGTRVIYHAIPARIMLSTSVQISQ